MIKRDLIVPDVQENLELVILNNSKDRVRYKDRSFKGNFTFSDPELKEELFYADVSVGGFYEMTRTWHHFNGQDYKKQISGFFLPHLTEYETVDFLEELDEANLNNKVLKLLRNAYGIGDEDYVGIPDLDDLLPSQFQI